MRQQVMSESGGRRRICKPCRLFLTREKPHRRAGEAGASSSTQGMTVPFYFFLPSGILGVMEIIYHLMWADGLIKLNRKAFTAVLGV